jgi:diguanylate cyclase (GGDEF)-like protein
VVKKVVRREDLLSRYGGEEFVLVAVESTLASAKEMAERIRAIVERHTPLVRGEALPHDRVARRRRGHRWTAPRRRAS